MAEQPVAARKAAANGSPCILLQAIKACIVRTDTSIMVQLKSIAHIKPVYAEISLCLQLFWGTKLESKERRHLKGWAETRDLVTLVQVAQRMLDYCNMSCSRRNYERIATMGLSILAASRIYIKWVCRMIQPLSQLVLLTTSQLIHQTKTRCSPFYL